MGSGNLINLSILLQWFVEHDLKKPCVAFMYVFLCGLHVCFPVCISCVFSCVAFMYVFLCGLHVCFPVWPSCVFSCVDFMPLFLFFCPLGLGGRVRSPGGLNSFRGTLHDG